MNENTNTKQSGSSENDSFRFALARNVFSPMAGVRIENWSELIDRRDVDIPIRYWPRTMFTMAMGMLNSVVARYEDEKFGPELEDVEVEAPVFVLGHHRSGTTHLWNLLATDDQFIYPVITDAIFPDTCLTFQSASRTLAKYLTPRKRPQDDVENDVNSPMSEEWALCVNSFQSTHMIRFLPQHIDFYKRYLTMENVPEDEREEWREKFDEFARKVLLLHGPDSTYLSKSPTHTAKVDLLLEIYPDARFVHIHRDPYRVYQSTLHMEKKSLPYCAYEEADLEDHEEFVRWRYRRMYESFFEHRDEIPEGQFAEIAYRDLVDDRIGGIERIYEQLGLGSFEAMRPDLQQYVDSIADYETNSYPELPESKRRQLQEEWGFVFDELGYET